MSEWKKDDGQMPMLDESWDEVADPYNRAEKTAADELLEHETWDDKPKKMWVSGGIGPIPDLDPYHERTTPLPIIEDPDLPAGIFIGDFGMDGEQLTLGLGCVPRPPEDEKGTARQDVLEEAISLITGDRNNTYGPPTQDFRRTADALTAMGYRRMDAAGELPLTIQPSDVAIIVAMVKISRLMHQRGKRDNWADLAGYAGCGYECALEE